MSEQNTQREAAVQQQQAVAQSRNLNAELQILAKFGGFNVLESSVDGIQNMNPERKARRNIFLSDPERAAERKELEKRLEMWVDMLKGNKSISEMVELCQKNCGGVRSAIPEPAESGGRGQAVGEVLPHGHALLQEYGFRQDQEYLHCKRFDEPAYRFGQLLLYRCHCKRASCEL